jgi:excisionase family DNA binding protein
MSELLTAAEMAARLRIRPTTLQEWAREGRVPSVRITPKVIRFDPDAVILSLSTQKPATAGGSDEARA